MNRRQRRASAPLPAPLEAQTTLVDQMFAEAVERHRAGQMPQAEALYRATLALEARYASASYNLGLLLHGQHRLDDAIAAYRHAIAVQPDYFDAYSNLGVALQDRGALDEAVGVYRAVIAMKPDFAMAVCNLGVALRAQGCIEEAAAALRQAIALQPGNDGAYANLGAVLLDLGEGEAAAAASRRAIALRPDQERAYFNLGSACKALCRLDEAAAALRRAVELRPDFAEAHFTLGQVLLLQGAFDAGWAEYDWRWKLAEYAWLRNIHGTFHQPLWSGEDLSDRTILVYGEQGLGDTIHFARYVPLLARRAGHVVLAVHPPLRKVFEGLAVHGMGNVTLTSLDTPSLPPFDVHCPLLSLPRVFGTTLDTIPAQIPYLSAGTADEARWHARLGAHHRTQTGEPQGEQLRVGVVWAGNPTQTGDRFRSPRLAAVRHLFDVPGVDFVTLQLGAGREDIAVVGLPHGVLDLGAEIADFTDTAAIMTGLDLVITSCTAPLHLAGALGVATWAMIPFSPHFPWLLERTDSPWYPSVRLYRQGRHGSDWSGVVARIVRDLTALTAGPP